MSLVHLRTFVEVHRRGSISEAARLLGLTQPAVSGHIATLEAQLGRPLFQRHARGVVPTAIADDLAASLGQSGPVWASLWTVPRPRWPQSRRGRPSCRAWCIWRDRPNT